MHRRQPSIPYIPATKATHWCSCKKKVTVSTPLQALHFCRSHYTSEKEMQTNRGQNKDKVLKHFFKKETHFKLRKPNFSILSLTWIKRWTSHRTRSQQSSHNFTSWGVTDLYRAVPRPRGKHWHLFLNTQTRHSCRMAPTFPKRSVELHVEVHIVGEIKWSKVWNDEQSLQHADLELLLLCATYDLALPNRLHRQFNWINAALKSDADLST